MTTKEIKLTLIGLPEDPSMEYSIVQVEEDLDKYLKRGWVKTSEEITVVFTSLPKEEIFQNQLKGFDKAISLELAESQVKVNLLEEGKQKLLALPSQSFQDSL